VMELDSRGHKIKSTIEYADDYLTKGIGRIVGDARDTLRLATIMKTYNVTKTAKGSRPAWIENAPTPIKRAAS
jgi:hypothetical protein